MHSLLSRIHLKAAMVVAAIAIPLATTGALAVPAIANAQTTGASAYPTPSQSDCANGLAALGYRSNPYATPEQQQQSVAQFLSLQQNIVNARIVGYFVSATRAWLGGFAKGFANRSAAG
jgi:hypothetical protein